MIFDNFLFSITKEIYFLSLWVQVHLGHVVMFLAVYDPIYLVFINIAF